MKNMSHKQYIGLLSVNFVISVILTGGYFEICAALISCLLSATLFLKIRQEKKINIHANDALLFVVGIVVFYSLSVFGAIDSGLAVWGIVKYLPLLLWGLNCAVITNEERCMIIYDIPFAVSGLTIISLILCVIPFVRGQMFVAGRFGSFIMYPNTYAALLAVALLVWNDRYFAGKKQSESENNKFVEIVYALELITIIIGLYLSASRAVIGFLIPVLVIQFLMKAKEKKIVLQDGKLRTAIKYVVIALVPVAGLIIIGICTNHTGIIGHLSNISITESTMLGRLIYWKDALRVILKKPLGLGYWGYYCSQGSFQTAVYSVRNAHNGFIQIMLDAGWVPFILLVIAIFKGFTSKQVTRMQKLILLFLILHDSFDMNSDFVCMWMLLILCLDWENLKKHSFEPELRLSAAILAICCIGSLYIGIASTAYYAGNNKLAVALYPWNTLADLDLMVSASDDEQEEIADRILSQNSYIALAWAVKANKSLEKGDVTTYLKDKEKSISLNKYDLSGYEDYFTVLADLYGIYSKSDEGESAEVCRKKMLNIETTINSVLESTDPLAWKIADKPDLELPETYQKYLEYLKEQ